ncbi:MAG: acetyl-CoA hydrolase/transferase C-terminal domain-containing protein, partial [Bdellovibrionales bacterium]
KREVFDLEKSVRRYLHGAFFLGSKEFYQWIRDLDRDGDTGFCMTRVSKVNDLYDENELAIRRQRVKARFFNSTMNVTLLGGAASETTEDGLVVSGVGGQYNFVAMSHELPDSYSALMLRSARHSKKGLESNFLWGQGQLTIPRHLRDVVISEFGVAFLKNRTDQEVIQAQIMIANSSFQEELRQTAVRNLKLAPEWQIPDWARTNTEGWPSHFLAEYKKQGLFAAFPFGSDFTPEEERLARALLILKKALSSKSQLMQLFWRGLCAHRVEFHAELARMDLLGGGLKERVYRALLMGALS